MTNEALVAQIQSGDQRRLLELWTQVERFVWGKARRRYLLSEGLGGVEIEDLYQSGYIALVAAADSYDPDGGRSFVGWLALYLKTAFAEAAGYRSRKQARDPLLRAASLDAPVGDDPDGSTLAELQSDPAAEHEIEAVVEQDRLDRLRAVLEEALARLPEDQQSAIRRRYYSWDQVPLSGAEKDRDAAAYKAALRALRHPTNSRALLAYWR